jgi:hypothetical protein
MRNWISVCVRASLVLGLFVTGTAQAQQQFAIGDRVVLSSPLVILWKSTAAMAEGAMVGKAAIDGRQPGRQGEIESARAVMPYINCATRGPVPAVVTDTHPSSRAVTVVITGGVEVNCKGVIPVADVQRTGR